MAPLMGIHVTGHALDRVRQRGLLPDGKHPLPFVYGEVRQALVEGRIAKSQPRWCAGEKKRGHSQRGTMRFVWDVDELRCYVIKRGIRDHADGTATKHRKPGTNWTVVTAMGRAK